MYELRHFVSLESQRPEGRGSLLKAKGDRLAPAGGGPGLARMSLASASLPKSISKQAPEVLPRASRARRYGIDCESELRWHAKEPGGDYKQKLLIKNVSNQVPRVAGIAHPVALPPPCVLFACAGSSASPLNRSCGIARVH
jgi:hypothetical protein